MPDFFDVFNSTLATSQQQRDPYHKSFIERVFSPFQAPQETLFSLTKGIGDNGFQASDLWGAVSHGARYFNPFGNEKPINPDDIRQTFFGEQANLGGGWKFAENTAIGLLYDPLLFTGLLKGVGVLEQGTKAAGLVSRITNPAEVAIDGLKLASTKVVGPLAKTAAVAALGEERATRWGTSLMQNLVSRNFGIPDELVRAAASRDQRIFAWRDEGFRVIKKSQQLGGAEAQRLLNQALEMDAAYARFGGKELTRDMTRQLDTFEARLTKAGVDKDLFWQTYGEYRKLDDAIGLDLLNSGAIDGSQYTDLKGTHLRRMYQAVENPEVYAKRIEDLDPTRLAEAGLSKQDRLRTNTGRLFETLNDFRSKLQDKLRPAAAGIGHANQSPLFDITETLGLSKAVRAGDAGSLPRQLLDKMYGTNGDNIIATMQKRGASTEDVFARFSAMAEANPTLDALYVAARTAPDTMADKARKFAEQGFELAKQEKNSNYARAFRYFIEDTRPTFGVDGKLEAVVGAARYFEDSSVAGGRFNTKAFVNDFQDFVKANSDATIDDVLGHVKDRMMAGVDLPPEFFASLANHISDGGLAVERGTQFYADMVRGWAQNPSVTWRTMRERLEVVSKRENIPDLIREAMGEVTTAAPKVASQVSDAGKVLETHKFLDQMAGARRATLADLESLTKAKTLGFDTPEARTLVEGVAKRMGLSTDELATDIPRLLEEGPGAIVGSKGGSGWASVARDEAAGHTVHLGKSEGYGELADMWVSPAVAAMVNHMEGVTQAGNEIDRLGLKTMELLRKGTGLFKQMKVLLDPVAQFRNFVGNAVLMDMSGTSPFRVDIMRRAASELVQYGRKLQPGEYMKLAEDAGLTLFQHTMSKSELGVFADRIASAGEYKPQNWREAMQHAYASFRHSDSNPVNQAAKLFEFNERLFKMTVFMDRMDRLESGFVKAGKLLTPEARRGFAQQAGSIAEQALFNYADVPYMVDFARKYGVVPFITFPFKAAPFVAQTLYEHPYRVLKYERGVDAINAGLAGSSDDAAKEIQSLPSHIRDQMVVRLPFKDAQGRPQYLDLSYFMPWYVIQDMAETAKATQGQAGTGGFRSGIMTPPSLALLDAIRLNQDSLGRPIVDPSRPGPQNFGAIASYLWKFIAPPSFPGGARADSVGRQMQAMAGPEPTPQDWGAKVGAWWRGAPVFPEFRENVTAARGFAPQTQSQVQGGQLTQGLGALLQALGVQDTSALDAGSRAGVLEGFVEGTLTGGTHASDPTQATMQDVAAYRGSRTDAFRAIADIRANQGMSVAEKNRRIQHILKSLEKSGEDASRALNSR